MTENILFPTGHTENIIELKNISFGYTDDLVLEDINLVIHKGDYLGVIGPNGGGKTTLLKIMLGLLDPARGSVRLYGEDIGKFQGWSKFAYISQKSANFEQFPVTVEEVVMMGRYGKRGLLGFLTQEDKDIARESLRKVGMLDFGKRLIHHLSGGQQQRVFIARSLAAEPEVIFLDEPASGVDLETQEQFYALLEKLNKEMKLTLILVSHDIDVIAHEATEVACINKRLVYHGTPEQFIKDEYLKNLYGKGVKFILHNH